MLTQPRSHSACPPPDGLRAGPVATTRQSVTPQQIAAVVDGLAAAIKADDDCDIFGPWAVASLAAKLGLTVALSTSDAPAVVVADIGNDWADEVLLGLDKRPDEREQVLGAVCAVVTRLVETIRLLAPQDHKKGRERGVGA